MDDSHDDKARHFGDEEQRSGDESPAVDEKDVVSSGKDMNEFFSEQGSKKCSKWYTAGKNTSGSLSWHCNFKGLDDGVKVNSTDVDETVAKIEIREAEIDDNEHYMPIGFVSGFPFGWNCMGLLMGICLEIVILNFHNF